MTSLVDPHTDLVAACAGRSPLWDDVVAGETTDARFLRHLEAVRICNICPLRAACAAYADDHLEEITGIWAAKQITSQHNVRDVWLKYLKHIRTDYHEKCENHVPAAAPL